MGFIQWEKYLLSGKAEALAMTQAALIGQTFAMLSGVSFRLSIQCVYMRLTSIETKRPSYPSDISWYSHDGK